MLHGNGGFHQHPTAHGKSCCDPWARDGWHARRISARVKGMPLSDRLPHTSFQHACLTNFTVVVTSHLFSLVSRHFHRERLSLRYLSSLAGRRGAKASILDTEFPAWLPECRQATSSGVAGSGVTAPFAKLIVLRAKNQHRRPCAEGETATAKAAAINARSVRQPTCQLSGSTTSTTPPPHGSGSGLEQQSS